MYKKILLATDGSDHSVRGAEKVIDICENKECKVVIFHSIKHVLDKISISNTSSNRTYFPVSSYPGMSYFTHPVFIAKESSHEIINQYREQIENKGINILNSMKEMFETAHITVETRLTEEENPDEYILRVIKEENFDLIVIGNRGIHSRLREILMGSVAEKILTHSTCDVLVIK